MAKATKKTTKKSTKKAKKSTKKSAKKTTGKKKAKKSTKKSAKKTTGKKAPVAKKEGLRKPQVRILKALSKSAKPLTRSQIAQKAPCDAACCVEWIGSSDPDTRKSNDKKHFMSLLSLGYVKDQISETEDARSSISYSLTQKGKKALKAEG